MASISKDTKKDQKDGNKVNNDIFTTITKTSKKIPHGFMGVANEHMQNLFEAFLDNDRTKIQKALKNTSINAWNGFYESVPLVLARSYVNLKTIDLVIEFHGAIEHLYFGAAQSGATELMTYLEEKAEKLKIRLDYHQACFFAAWGQQEDVLELLIKKLALMPNLKTYNQILAGCYASGNKRLITTYSDRLYKYWAFIDKMMNTRITAPVMLEMIAFTGDENLILTTFKNALTELLPVKSMTGMLSLIASSTTGNLKVSETLTLNNISDTASNVIGRATFRGLNLLNSIKNLLTSNQSSIGSVPLNYQLILENTATAGRETLLLEFINTLSNKQKQEIDYHAIANEAIKWGHLNIVKKMVSIIKKMYEESKNNLIAPNYSKLFLTAARSAHNSIISYLLDEIKKAKQQADFHALTALPAAWGNTDLVLATIKNSTILNQVPDYESIMHTAASCGHLICLQEVHKHSNISPDWFSIFATAENKENLEHEELHYRCQSIQEFVLEKITGYSEEQLLDLIDRYILLGSARTSTSEKETTEKLAPIIQKINTAACIAVTKSFKLTDILIQYIIALGGIPEYNKIALICTKDNDQQKALSYLIEKMRRFNIMPDYDEFIKAANGDLKNILIKEKNEHLYPRFRGKVSKKTQYLLEAFWHKNIKEIEINKYYLHGRNAQEETIGLVLARANADDGIIQLLLKYNADLQDLFLGAVEGGHLPLLKSLFLVREKIPTRHIIPDYNLMVSLALCHENTEIVNFLIEERAKEYNQGTEGIVHLGAKHPIQFAHRIGHSARGVYISALRSAIQKILEGNALPNYILPMVAESGCTPAAKAFLNKLARTKQDVPHLHQCAIAAAQSNNVDLLFFIIQKMIKNQIPPAFVRYAGAAAENGHEELAMSLFAKSKFFGENASLIKIIMCSAFGGQEELLNKFIHLYMNCFGNKVDFNEIATSAVFKQHNGIALSCIKYMNGNNIVPEYQKIAESAIGDFKNFLLEKAAEYNQQKSIGTDNKTKQESIKTMEEILDASAFDFLEPFPNNFSFKLDKKSSFSSIIDNMIGTHLRTLYTITGEKTSENSKEQIQKFKDTHSKYLKEFLINQFNFVNAKLLEPGLLPNGANNDSDYLTIDLRILRQKLPPEHIIRKIKIKSINLKKHEVEDLVMKCGLMISPDTKDDRKNFDEELFLKACREVLMDKLFIEHICNTQDFLTAKKEHEEKSKQIKSADELKRFDLFYQEFLNFPSQFEKSVAKFETRMDEIYKLKLSIDVTCKENNDEATNQNHKKLKQIHNANQSRLHFAKSALTRADGIEKLLSPLISSFESIYEKLKSENEKIYAEKNTTQLEQNINRLIEIEKNCIKHMQELDAVRAELTTISERLDEQSELLSLDKKRIQESIEKERTLTAQTKLIAEQKAILDAIKLAREKRELAIKRQAAETLRAEKRKRWLDEIQRRKDAAVKARADKIIKAELEKLRIEKYKKEELDELKKEKIARMDERTRQIIEQHFEEFKIMLSLMTFLDENSEVESSALLGKLAQTLEAMKHYKGNVVLSTLAKEARNTLYHGANLLDPKSLAEYCANPKSAFSKTEDCSNPKSDPSNTPNLRERLLKMNLELLTFDWESTESLEETPLPEFFVELVLYPRKIANIDVTKTTPMALFKILEKNTAPNMPNMPKINKIKTPTYAVCKKNVDIHYRKLLKIQKEYPATPHYQLVFEAAQGYCHAKISKYARRLKKIDTAQYQNSSKGNAKILEEIIKLGDKFRHNLPLETPQTAASAITSSSSAVSSNTTSASQPPVMIHMMTAAASASAADTSTAASIASVPTSPSLQTNIQTDKGNHIKF